MNLPASCNEFERVIGTPLTLRLVSVAKDRRIYIPANPVHADHPLARAVGLDAATLLHKQFGGCIMAYPSQRVRSCIRDREIARAWKAGRDIRQLARDHKVCERTAIRALSRIKTSDLVEPIQLDGAVPTPGIGSSGTGGMRVTRTTATKA